MTTIAMIAVDLVAICILTFGLYFPRHHRTDLVAAFLGVNVGVLAVAIVLLDSSVGTGLGLGLFGVLSIIRLRSTEISQHEVAYYFASLAVGLISGMSTVPTALTLGLIALVLLSLAVGDSPRLLGAHRSQLVHLDRAVTDEGDLRATLAELLGATVTDVQVVRLDLVNDLTVVEVRYRVPSRGHDAGSARDHGRPVGTRVAHTGAAGRRGAGAEVAARAAARPRTSPVTAVPATGAPASATEVAR